ncbi:MAG: GNAT family N-acetyltransferase [Candidatus Odinarchaeota archaeon]
MRFVVLSYYHSHSGPSILHSIPGELHPEIANDICRTLDFLEEPGFFIQHKSNHTTVNWYFEIPNECARGGKDMLLVSVVLVCDHIDPLSLEDPIRWFVDELKNVNGLCRVLYLDNADKVSEKDNEHVQTIQDEIKAKLRSFRDSLPDELPPIIRKMEVSDLERITEIDYQLLGERRPEFWQRKIQLLAKNSDIPPLVAETGCRVIGFILGNASRWEYFVPENVGWVDTLGVDAAYQRKGVARILMGELLNWMNKLGVDSVYTLVKWRDGNLLSFFDHMGFKRGEMISLEHRIEVGDTGSDHVELNKFSPSKGTIEVKGDSLPGLPLVIRKMEVSDLERITEIDYQLLGERRPEFWQRKIQLLAKNSDIPPLVAETGCRVIGFILGNASSWEYFVPENVGWVDTLGVDAAYQRKGVARILMLEILAQMKKAGVNTVHALVNWRDGNLLSFFDHMGFKKGEMINLERRIEVGDTEPSYHSFLTHKIQER